MLFAVGQSQGRTFRAPLQLSGLADSDPNVAALQKALQVLSQRALNPMISPGPPTGMINVATMNAIVAALGILTSKLPMPLANGVKGALSSGAQSLDAQNFVSQYAGEFADAALAAAATMPAPSAISSFAYQAEQTSPWVYVMIAGALLVGYRLFSKPSTNG